MGFIFLFVIIGCNSPKRLQRIYGFSDNCRKSYEFFLNRITRDDNDLIEFIEPAKETYEKLLSEHYNNKGLCWSDVLPEKGVLKLFGTPHKRDIGKTSGDITITYFIRTKECMKLSGPKGLPKECGRLVFFFSKEGQPKGSVFYAFNAARKYND